MYRIRGTPDGQARLVLFMAPKMTEFPCGMYRYAST
jgi:hypothetical protein